MADNEPNRPRSRRWIVVVVLLVFYVLSFGPVTWVVARLDPPTQSIAILYMIVYGPLIWVAERAPWFGALLVWYGDLI